jgi:hypothetical protein
MWFEEAVMKFLPYNREQVCPLLPHVLGGLEVAAKQPSQRLQ